MSLKKSKLSREQMREIYSGIKDSVTGLVSRGGSTLEGGATEGLQLPKLKRDWSVSVLLPTIGGLACVRILLSALTLAGYVVPPKAEAVVIAKEQLERDPNRRFLFEAFDRRRAELEKRSAELEQREQEFKQQEQELSVRLAELRQLTHKLKDERTKKGVERDAQLEQLANVYVSMKPEESARLLQQLDTMIALDLIKKMPEKRIGQLLSLMEPERALLITRMLTGGKEVVAK